LNISADSSFIVALYLVDSHSLDARRRMAAKPLVVLTPINRVELAHAVHYQVFRARITLAEAVRALRAFEEDCGRGVWASLDLPARIWATAIDLARRHSPALGVRTLDSLHVACALEFGADKFWTFDERQAKLAKTVGLDTSP